MAADFLERILETKRAEVDEARRRISDGEIRRMAEDSTDRRPFFERLVGPGPSGVNIIAEIKRASPSKGLIRADLDPARYAKTYESAGAAALSVLTDRQYFQGSFDDLRNARAATAIPVLRKDFLVSAYQVYEAAALGADAVLLIARILDREFLKDCLLLCGDLRLGALVEVHHEKELEDATYAGGRLIGINNRDLSTFQTDVGNCIRIARYLEDDQVGVAESGIRGRSDIERVLGEAGIHNFLIGESLVRAGDTEGFLRGLLGIEPFSETGAKDGENGGAS